jgi:hypothetical protein
MKKKYYIYALLLFYINIIIFADSDAYSSYVDYPFSVRFSDKEILFHEDKNAGEAIFSRAGQYTVNYEYSVPFLTIDYDDGENKKLLMLRDDTICALFNNNELVFLGANTSFNRREGFVTPSRITATSYLAENNVMYSPDVLTRKPRLDNPWVENVIGQGIGEKLFITNTIAIEMFISIGFVSFNRPYLYTMNSRPKEIRISVDGKFSFIQHLSDTPNYQKIIFPEGVINNDIIVIEILSVYEGTRYQDTCINNIIVKMW